MINGVINMAPQQDKIKIKIKFQKWELRTYDFRKFRKWELWTYDFRKRRKLNKDLPQVYSVKRTCGRWTTAGKGSEDEPQVHSVKKTCGSEADVCGRRRGVSPYSVILKCLVLIASLTRQHSPSN